MTLINEVSDEVFELCQIVAKDLAGQFKALSALERIEMLQDISERMQEIDDFPEWEDLSIDLRNRIIDSV